MCASSAVKASRRRSFCPWKGSTVAIWIPERNCSPRSSSQFSCTVPDLPGTRSTQAGRGMIFPSRQVHDASELTGPSAASVLVMPHASHQPPAPEPPQKRAGSSDAARRHSLIRDHTVFHVVASCRARPAIVAPSKRNCRIAQRIARTMSTTESHTEGLSTDISRRLAPERTSALHGASPGRL